MVNKIPNPRLSFWERLLTSVVPPIAWVILRLMALTLRGSVCSGGEVIERLVRERRPMILVGWHNRTFVCAPFLERLLARQGLKIGILVSLSRDGELMAGVARLAGFQVIRGSATLGGMAALRAMRRALTRNGWSVGIAADGSQGPLYDCKPGPLILAQITGVPLLPMAGFAERCWRLKSWDRMIVPKPFSRLSLAVGEPISVPPELDSQGLEEQIDNLSETLTALVKRAKDAFATDTGPSE